MYITLNTNFVFIEAQLTEIQHSSESKGISIIIPCYNEEKRIIATLQELDSFLSKENINGEIIVCDGGSFDTTVKLVTEYIEHANHRLKLLKTNIRMGKGASIRYGVTEAAHDKVLFIDADLPTDLVNITLFLQKIDNDTDAVFGMRLHKRFNVEEPLIRRILSLGFHKLVKYFFGINHDTQCGFKGIKRQVALEVLEHVNSDDFLFDVDLTVQLHKFGYKIVEVPIIWYFRKWSRLRITENIFRMFLGLVKIWLKEKVPEPFHTENEKELERFYESIEGDVRARASKSLFLPRRLWYKKKDNSLANAILEFNYNKQHAAMKVLDAGCGSGNILAILKDKGIKNVNGIEIAASAVNYVNQRFHQNVCVKGDIRSISFPDEYFDAVICSEVLEHVKEPEHAFKEFARVLIPGGLLVLTTPRSTLLWYLIESTWTRLRRKHLEIHHTVVSDTWLMHLLHSAGFTDIKFDTILGGTLAFIKAQKPKYTNDEYVYALKSDIR